MAYNSEIRKVNFDQPPNLLKDNTVSVYAYILSF